MVSKTKIVNTDFTDNGEIGQRLVEERSLHRLSQTDLRIRTGVGKSTQLNYENGKSIPDAKYLQRLDHLGFDILYIVTGERSSAERMAPEYQNLLDAYIAAPESLRRAVFGVLLSPYKREWDKARVIPGYFRHEILGENDVRYVAYRESDSQEDKAGGQGDE